MKVQVTSEYRFTQLPDGSVWTETAFANSYWQRYLQVFDDVEIIARAKKATEAKADWQRVDGPRVSLIALPDYVGPFGFLRAKSKIQKKMTSVITGKHAVILAVPSAIAQIAEKILRRKNLNYGTEMLGDPWEVFSSSGVRHPLRVFFRYMLTYQTQRQVRGACSALYVTEGTLQKRYPASPLARPVGVSNVELFSDYFVSEPRVFSSQKQLRLVSVGSLEQMYKNPDIVLHAIAKCIHRGIQLKLTWLGGGKFLTQMEELAKTLGIQDQVKFLGQISSGDALRSSLDQADLFVLASKTEGLPRALLEAMARALPSIGANVGGIPELLESENLFAPNDADALVKKITELLADHTRLTKMSARNLAKSQEFAKEKLDHKRAAFLEHLRTQTEHALK